MQNENQILTFITNLESTISEQKEDFWGTSQYLSKMVFCDPEDRLAIISLLQNTEK